MKIIYSIFLALAMLPAAFSQLSTEATDISPLLIGERFPDLELSAVGGESTLLSEVFAKGPSVFVFYRGGWCPYCTKHLAAIGQSEDKILEMGYQIIAISPDSPEKLAGTMEKEAVNYLLLSDADGALAREVGVAFQTPEKYGKMLLDHSGGKNEGFLPVPSVFIVGKKGEILFEHINPDYRQRLEPGLLLAVLAALRA